MDRLRLPIAPGLLAGLFLAWPAAAQTPASAQTPAPTTAIVARYAVIFEEPRNDSPMVGDVAVGTVLEVLGRSEDYYLVSPPAGSDGIAWQRGWIPVVAFQPVPGSRSSVPGGTSNTSKTSNSSNNSGGRLMVRGFGYGGGLLFTASESFETILGGGFNSVFGIGGQVVFPNGVFAQASFDRFRDTGTRALVSGTQIFTLEIPNQITVTPILATVGYRGTKSGAIVPYFGGGMGWYTLEETSPSIPGAERVSSQHTGYHILGGAEFPVMRWMSIAGELQWATVPNALGDSGVSAVFGEKDLGGTSFRFKVIAGY
jgi:hypothetical protein